MIQRKILQTIWLYLNLQVINKMKPDLIQNLSYSVLEVVELTEKRILKCKNPYGYTIPKNNFNVRIVKKYKKQQVLTIFYKGRY